MIENSSAGLVMLPGELTVTVTREEAHQPALALYNVPVGRERQVAVELTWCTITSGKYRGGHAIEVRLDGWRVGELTYLMSQRYAPFVAQVTARGGRPGCVAAVLRTGKGLEITLRLPRAEDLAPTYVTSPAAPLPPAPAKRPVRTAGLIAAGAVVLIVFIAAMVGNNSDTPPAGTASDTTTTAPTTTETTTTAVPKPKPKAKPKPKPAPAPRTTTHKPAPAPKPKPAPKPAATCDPNYSGCVPVASDVDCAGGSGNGPAYVAGPVEVIGSDIYDLDRDGDGVACE
ncbi:MAG TPA: hypothetical protein VGP26_08275 [Actinophytocola sp.]|nr:hypothetical protein [Actinophytocola sp.]